MSRIYYGKKKNVLLFTPILIISVVLIILLWNEKNDIFIVNLLKINIPMIYSVLIL